MRGNRRNKGFSLTEVMMAVGILAIGMSFIAGVFPVGMRLATMAAEQTIAVVIADEAFAKIRLYAVGNPADPADDIVLDALFINELRDFNDPVIFPATPNINPHVFAYPSTDIDISQKQYYWSALCRRTDLLGTVVQVTVLVSRKTGPNLQYYQPAATGMVDWAAPYYTDQPTPVKIIVSQPTGFNVDELQIDFLDPREITFVNDGGKIIDNETGQIYRVQERYAYDDSIIRLDRLWQGGATGFVWVVPPAVSGSRYPCIAIYQREIRF